MNTTADKTDPALWEKVKDETTKGAKGGKAGQWSARKAQLAVSEYKKAGGGYVGEKAEDNHLAEWTREEWGTKSGHKSEETGERYLPKEAIEKLSDKEYKRTSAKKRADTAKGQQHSAQPADVARKTAVVRGGTSKSELLAQAAKKGIAGRSRMTRDQLEQALEADPALDHRAVAQEFKQVVNMTPAQLRKWLDTPESHSVGMTHEGDRVTGPDQHEAVGHEMGRRILELKAKKASDFKAADYEAMRKVIGYVHRHGKQRPNGDITDTRWRKSLMNWGHDPLR